MSCNTIINDTDILKVYDVSEIKHIDLDSNCDSEDMKRSYIDIFDADRNSLLMVPIERIYHAATQLKSFNGIGKVAEHKLFVLTPRIRGNKISKRIHENEMLVYTQNEFNEIQLDAAWDGILVWKSLGFDYVDKTHEIFIYSWWKNYFLQAYGPMEISLKYDIILKHSTMALVPTKYTKDFGTWLHATGKNFSIPMYKRIT